MSVSRGKAESGLRCGEEAIADPPDGNEVDGVGGVVLDVASEADDEVIDGAGVRILVDTPDLFEDVLAGDDLTFVFGKVAEEVGFHEGEVGDAVGGDKFEGVKADGAVVEGVGCGLIERRGLAEFRSRWRLPGRAAEKGLDTDEEDVEIKGFGEIVVGTGFEAFEDVFGAGAGGEEEDWSVDLRFAEGSDDGEAITSRKHAVEDDSADLLWGVEEVGEGIVAVGLVVGRVAFGLKVEDESLGEVIFVFDDYDEGRGGEGVHRNRASILDGFCCEDDVLTEDAREQGVESVPCDLNADAKQDKRNDTQDAVSG